MSDKRLCARYDGPSGRYCRNVSYFQQDGPNVCRKHLIADLRRFEEDNARLAWYLDNRHLLEGVA